MALNKRQYTDGQTIITAANLNEIQDCIIAIEGAYVPKTRKVAGKALSSDITLAASDVGAVPTSRTVNSKALSSNITLSAADVGAVPVSRTVNSKALSSNITLNAADVGAVPTSRKVNNKALSSDITLAAADIGYGSSNVGAELGSIGDTVDHMNSNLVRWDVKTNGKIIFLGNSYGKNYANYPNMAKWPERTAEYLGLESHPLPTSDEPIAVDPSWNWFNVCRRSFSLYGTDGTSNAFITYLQQWVANNPNIDYNSIGAVVLVAGINDARSGRASRVLSCLDNLATYIKQQMPNAALYNGYCGWLDESRKAAADTHGGQLYQQSVAHEYMAGKQYGWNYLTGIENVFHDKSDMADYIHPNENGSKVIGLAVANALSTGGCSTVKTLVNVTAQGLDGADGRTKILDTLSSTVTVTNNAATVNNGTIRQWLQDNVIHSQWASLEFNISPALPMVYNHIYTLGTIDVPYSNQIDFGNQMLMCRTDEDNKGITGIICRVYVEPRKDASGIADINFQVKGYADGSQSKNVIRIVRFVGDTFKQTITD